MNPIFAAALEIQQWCTERNWHFCVIGGVAVQRWGEPRLTRDVDCTILTGFGREPAYVDDLLRGFTARIDNARAFALDKRVLLLTSRSGVPLDISLGALPYEERLLRRASSFLLQPNVPLITCSAEDLVVLKAFAARNRDWADIEGVILRQGQRLDDELIRRELLPLLDLKEDPADIAERLEQMFQIRPKS